MQVTSPMSGQTPRSPSPATFAGNATEEAPGADVVLPKSAITIGIALTLVLIGLSMAKLLNRFHRRAKLDNRSDVSDHTRELLRLQKSTRRRRGLLSGSRRLAISEQERRQWQLTVLSMWQSRHQDTEAEAVQDPHTQMLSRLRNAWLSRKRGQTLWMADSSAASTGAGGAGGGGRSAEELRAEVRRVALAWLARSREAEVMRRDSRRRASHNAMMRRLSGAWRQRLSQDRMRTIEEGCGDGDSRASSSDSFTTVPMPDWDEAGNGGEPGSPRDSGEEEGTEEAKEGDGKGSTDREEATEGRGYCQLL